MKSLTPLWLALIPLLLGAGLYRWVDENGVVTYSQTAPRSADGRAVERLSMPIHREPTDDSESAETAETSEPTATTTNAESDTAETADPDAERAHQAEVARVRQRNCDRAELLLAQLQSAPRLIVQENGGEPRMLPEDEHRERIVQARRAVAEHCGERR